MGQSPSIKQRVSLKDSSDSRRTLRNNTERPETITIGTNELIGTDPSNLPPALARLMAGQWKKDANPSKWNCKAADSRHLTH